MPRRPKARALRSLENVTVILAANSKVHNATRVARKVPANMTTHVVPNCTHHTMPMYPSDEIDRLVLSALE
ncbi:hypothetical protein GCM10007304_41850 [Rhodococcoides trifolii]|uniref:Alpha/beta hydrolase n=1 Tax=Rhodococcoides trifolii TaxID=908250 RepID=A0A917G5C0_9NOCA|nr:hypothetical protein [Rhodococcus trifolii]GGG23608.1 hypothetical protein GCM10007304_41850 [Rhodococcus trifolii]